MATVHDCRREIESLHEFFIDWYTGMEPESDFDRLTAVLGTDFNMITPDGKRVDREQVLEAIDSRYNQEEPDVIDIEIHNVDLIDSTGDQHLVLYEEWQERPEGWNGRVSSVLFREEPTKPNGLEWVFVQDTMIDDRSKPR